MSDEILIEYGDSPADTATLLLGAAEDLGYEPWVVRNQPEDQGFRVTEDVAVKAGLYSAPKAEKVEEPDAKKPAAKKTAAKRPAKKAAAKKAVAKKSASKG